MRLRKLDIDMGKGRFAIDLRNRGGVPLQACAIVGGNHSGKSLCYQVAMRAFQSTAQSSTGMRLFESNIQATIEFEYDGGIHAGVIRNGILVQKPGVSTMRIERNRITDGCLFYDLRSRLSLLNDKSTSSGEALARILLQDFYKNEIRNCLVFIDDFDLGLDETNAVELLRLLMRKCLERDNQLVVTGSRRETYVSLGDDSIKFLVSSVNMIEQVRSSL